MTLIEIKNISKMIRGQVILENISMSLSAGKIYGLKGVNGSGKSMLMRCILGLIRTNGGEISINGQVLGKDIEFPSSVGFLLESPTFLDQYSAYKNLKILSDMNHILRESEIKEVIHRVKLNPNDKKKYRKFSLGMKQRLGIANAIMEKPDILILDEPTNALDKDGIELVQEIILEEKKRGALIILACHDQIFLERVADEIICLDQGRVVQD